MKNFSISFLLIIFAGVVFSIMVWGLTNNAETSIIAMWMLMSAVQFVYASVQFVYASDEINTGQDLMFSLFTIITIMPMILAISGAIDLFPAVVITETLKVLAALLASINRGSERLNSSGIFFGLLAIISLTDGAILAVFKGLDIAVVIGFWLVGSLIVIYFVNSVTKKIELEEKSEIEKICNLESIAEAQRSGLITFFFVLAPVVIWLYIKEIMTPLSDSFQGMEHDARIGSNIVMILTIFMVLLITGRIYYYLLDKKLDRLWEEKQKLFLS